MSGVPGAGGQRRDHTDGLAGKLSADATADWLLEGDPSVVWQTQRDLLGRPEGTWSGIRARVATEGFGRRLLGLQDPEGTWAGGLYGPKWTSTNYTLLLLRRMGLDPSNAQAIAGTQALFDGARWVDGGISYWVGYEVAERCVNGMLLAISSYFAVDDERCEALAERLVAAKLEDGAWNCRDHQGHTHHSSFHTTISVLEGLAEWKRRTGSSDADDAMESGHEFMLSHSLFRSHSTGDVINEEWTRFHFPPRWHYDVLRGLDHLRSVGAPRDVRASEAIELVRGRRRPDGRWPIGPHYSGRTFFPLESGRQGGRWNTLRALRVLKWWEADPAVLS